MFHLGDKVVAYRDPQDKALPKKLKGVIVEGPRKASANNDERRVWAVFIEESHRTYWYLEKQIFKISELEEKVNRMI